MNSCIVHTRDAPDIRLDIRAFFNIRFPAVCRTLQAGYPVGYPAIEKTGYPAKYAAKFL